MTYQYNCKAVTVIKLAIFVVLYLAISSTIFLRLAMGQIEGVDPPLNMVNKLLDEQRYVDALELLETHSADLDKGLSSLYSKEDMREWVIRVAEDCIRNKMYHGSCPFTVNGIISLRELLAIGGDIYSSDELRRMYRYGEYGVVKSDELSACWKEASFRRTKATSCISLRLQLNR